MGEYQYRRGAGRYLEEGKRVQLTRMMAATIPGIAAIVSRKIARFRILLFVIDPTFHMVARE